MSEPVHTAWWRRGRPAGRLLTAACLGVLAVVPAQRAGAAPSVSKLQSTVTDLEQQASLLNVRYSTQAASKQTLAEHRLVDAQVLYTLKDYTRAAILLLDYVSKYKNTRGYPEAVFFLADSLYHKRDFLSAKRYFKLIATQMRGRYYQEALQRLVELSLRTGDYTGVEQYLNALANIPPAQLKPSVPYVKGKYYYFRKNLTAAVSTFRTVPKGHKYYMHSQYFIGAALVQQKNYGEAAKVFQGLLRVTPNGRYEKHVQDLAYLAVGRLLYEKGKLDQAIDMYQKISRRSPEFDTALYEIAWAYIKSDRHKKALRALDLLVLAQPESPFIPRVRVLQGNLLIRLEEWGRATELFTKTRERFVPVHNRMKQIMREHSDPNVFFDVLLARNLGELTATIEVPKLAVTWVKENSKVKRALDLVQDIRDIQDSIKEATQIIKRLERAINSPAKIKIFPEFATAKASALEVENKLLLVRREVLASITELTASVASASERAQLQALSSRRAGLEQRVKELPTSADGYKERRKTKLKRLDVLEKRLGQLSVVVESLKAQLRAAEKYFADTAGSKKPAVRASFRKQAQQMNVMIVGLQSELDEIRAAVADAKNSVGVGGADEVAERGVKETYKDVLSKEHALLASLRSRLSGQTAADFDTLSGLFRRCDKVDSVLTSFDKKLDAGVEQKLVGIRAALSEEKSQVGKYTVEVAQYKSESDTVAGGITYKGFQAVAQRFYEIVVRADVGIIDVAWALKDAKTKEVSRLVRQQKMDLRVLDAEFKEVLRED